MHAELYLLLRQRFMFRQSRVPEGVVGLSIGTIESARGRGWLFSEKEWETNNRKEGVVGLPTI